MVEETREKILTASLALFSERGYSGVGTKAIAETASVNEVTLFRLFGSKRELYLETFRRFKLTASQSYLLAGLSGSVSSDLLSIAGAITTLFHRNDRIVRMSLMDLSSFPEIDQDLKEEPELIISIIEGYIRSLVAKGSLEGDSERLARHFVTVLFGLSIHFIALSIVDAPYSLNDCVTDFVENFYRGNLVRAKDRSTEAELCPAAIGDDST